MLLASQEESQCKGWGLSTRRGLWGQTNPSKRQDQRPIGAEEAPPCPPGKLPAHLCPELYLLSPQPRRRWNFPAGTSLRWARLSTAACCAQMSHCGQLTSASATCAHPREHCQPEDCWVTQPGQKEAGKRDRPVSSGALPRCRPM